MDAFIIILVEPREKPLEGLTIPVIETPKQLRENRWQCAKVMRSSTDDPYGGLVEVNMPAVVAAGLSTPPTIRRATP